MNSPKSFAIMLQKGKGGMELGDQPLDSSCLNEIYGDLADLVGIDATLQIFAEFGGQQVSFPKKLLSKEYVINETIRCYNGKNLNELSKRFGYSERHLRALMKQRAEENKQKDN